MLRLESLGSLDLGAVRGFQFEKQKGTKKEYSTKLKTNQIILRPSALTVQPLDSSEISRTPLPRREVAHKQLLKAGQ